MSILLQHNSGRSSLLFVNYFFAKTTLQQPCPTHRPGAGPIGIDQQLGFRYLTFVVTNLDEVIQRLEAAHIAFTRPKTVIRPGTTIAMVKDPDGNIVEFVERSA
jgi:catechol 2,3-dioxygenase-like lactoylglutathione lyase family enzyme